MNTPEQTVTTCEKSLRLLADFWNLRIIEALKNGQLRYCEVQRAIGNLNPATLTKKLSELENAKLLKRTEDHAAVSYELTTLGTQALPVLSAIDTFSKQLK